MKNAIVELIQAMLAPGIMISACGLLILGMNNKYSIVVNRIRLLKEEKRKMKASHAEKKLTNLELQRFDSIGSQLSKMNIRLKFVRNAVFSYSIAVAFFIIASLLIGVKIGIQEYLLEPFIIGFFLTGMLSVLIGVLYAASEVWKGFKIVQIEIEEV